MPKPTKPDDRRLVRKPAAQKARPRLITLIPELDARLDRWARDNPKQVSPMIAKLVDIYLTEKGY